MRVLAFVFLLLALHRTATLPLPLVAPAYMGWSLEYEAGSVRVYPDPFILLQPEPRWRAQADPVRRARFMERLDDGQLRFRLFLIELAGRLPELMLMYSLAFALWRSSRPGPQAALSGVPWLMRAAAAGAVLALLTPVVEAARTGLLLQGIEPTATFSLNIDFDAVLRSLLFAVAAWVAAWTLAAGLRARAELAQIV